MHPKYGFIGRKGFTRKSHFFPKPFLQKNSYLGCIPGVLLEKVSHRPYFVSIGGRGGVTQGLGVRHHKLLIVAICGLQVKTPKKLPKTPKLTAKKVLKIPNRVFRQRSTLSILLSLE